MKQATAHAIWRKADTLRLGRMLAMGLMMGVIGRYLYVTAPPVPVQATSRISATATNTPAPTIKSEGVSPSGRD